MNGQSEPNSPWNTVFCTQCGSQVGSQLRFCPSCGSPSSSQAPAQPSAPRQEQHSGWSTPTPVAPTPYGNTSFGHDPYYVPVSRRPRKWPYVLIAAAVVLTGAGVGGLLYLGSEDPFPEEAASLLISEEDLTPGWSLPDDASSSQDESDRDLDRDLDNVSSKMNQCMGIGEVYSQSGVSYGYTLVGGGALVGSDVMVYGTPAEAERMAVGIGSPAGLQCLDDAVREVTEALAATYRRGGVQGLVVARAGEPIIEEFVGPGIVTASATYSLSTQGEPILAINMEVTPIVSGTTLALYTGGLVVTYVEVPDLAAIDGASEAISQIIRNAARRNGVL